MRPVVVVDGTPHVGRALDVRDTGHSAETVARAIRGEETVRVSVAGVGDPGPLFERVGVVRPDRSVRRRAVLAAVARSLGRRAPEDDARERVEAELASLSAPETGFAAARERVATAGRERDRLRERAAMLRGRIQALRDWEVDATDALAEFRSVARSLSEAETERAAAIQALDRDHAQARTGWDARARRLELRDRADNLARRARAWLADGVRDSVNRAVRLVPNADATGIPDAPPDVLSLAAVRVGTARVPVVLACDRFSSSAAAADWLDAPVVRVEV